MGNVYIDLDFLVFILLQSAVLMEMTPDIKINIPSN